MDRFKTVPFSANDFTFRDIEWKIIVLKHREGWIGVGYHVLNLGTKKSFKASFNTEILNYTNHVVHNISSIGNGYGLTTFNKNKNVFWSPGNHLLISTNILFGNPDIYLQNNTFRLRCNIYL